MQGIDDVDEPRATMDVDAGVWVRLLNDRVLSPEQFRALSAEERGLVEFTPVRFDNEQIGERIERLHNGEEPVPLGQRVSIVDGGDDAPDDEQVIFIVWDKQTKRSPSMQEIESTSGAYGQYGGANRAHLVCYSYPKAITVGANAEKDFEVSRKPWTSPRVLELEPHIVKMLQRRIVRWPPQPIAPTPTLIEAVKGHDIPRVLECLEYDGPFTIPHSLFVTALSLPLYPGCTNSVIVKALLDAGVDNLTEPVDSTVVNWARFDQDITPGGTPFFLSCDLHRLDCALLILEHERARAKQGRSPPPGTLESSLDAPLQSGASPLHFACQHGEETTVRFLITQRADLHRRRGTGGGPLFAACQNGFPRIAAMLLAAKASVEHAMQRTGTTPLMAACLTGNTETVSLLLEAKADVTTKAALDGATARSLTARAHEAEGKLTKAQMDAVIKLLTEGVVDRERLRDGERMIICGLSGRPELNGRGVVVRSYAPQKERYIVEVAERLSFDGIEGIIHEEEPVLLKRQNLECAPGDEISFPFIEPSVFISQMRLHGGVCACAALVRDGQVSPWALNAFHADRTMSRGGGTLLVMATLCLTLGREELVKALLEANADASGGEYTPSSGKPTPLMGACQYGHIEVVKLLLEHGAATTIHVEDATSGLLPAVCISSIKHHPRLLSRLTHIHIRVSPPFGSDCDS